MAAINMMVPGCGVAVGDVTGDGKPDLVFSSFSGVSVFKNEGSLRFKDITASSGIHVDSANFATGVTLVDIDADGDLDLFVARWQNPCRLYINNGNGTFTDRAPNFGLNVTEESVHSVFFDYNNDGLVDCYILVYSNSQNVKVGATSRSSPIPDPTHSPTEVRHTGKSDYLFKNNGNGTFTDVSAEAGIADVGMGLSATVGDITMDGWPDIYVANDFNSTDIIYINNKNGTFTARQNEMTRRSSLFSMGSDIGDLNNDGLPDIVTTDMLPDNHVRRITNGGMTGDMSIYNPTYDSNQISRNMVHLNRGNNLFSDVGYMTGMAATDWSWSCLIADFDTDGRPDVFIANGYASDISNQDYVYNLSQSTATAIKADYLREPNFMFQNTGPLTYKSVAEQWGIDDISATMGAAYADLDGDGDLELIVANLDTVPFIYKNNSSSNKNSNWIQFKFLGRASMPSGLGAKVWVVAGGQKQYRENYVVRGYQSTVSGTLHVGLGANKLVDSAIVEWPDGSREVLTKIKSNQTITFNHSRATLSASKTASVKKSFSFLEVSDETNLKHVHYENAFDDFKRYRLAPLRFSWGGPAVAVADINNDGADDVIIGGSKGYPTTTYMQQQSGRFAKITTNILGADSVIEDQAILLIDIDGDGDKDLLIAGGGPEFPDGDPAKDLHVFINDGRGRFTKKKIGIPPVLTNATCMAAADYDLDGDLDVIVGGGVMTDNYPYPSKSFLLNNDGNGNFTDVTDSVLGELRFVGITRSVLWTDVNNDNKPDVIVCGEWMPITVFINTGNGFVNSTEKYGLKNTTGWWYSINGADVDNDGDIDYVIGNVGTNTRYQGTPENPIELFAADFDENGSVDALITYNVDGKRCLVRDRGKIFSQMPTLNRKFNKYSDFAHASLTDIASQSVLDTCLHRSAVEMRSVILVNNGKAPFTLKPLPEIAQISPVLGSIFLDLNDDQFIDLITVGNMYGAEDDVVRYDAGKGLVLYGNGNGSFTASTFQETGFYSQYDARGLVGISNFSNGSVPYRLLTLTNQASSKVFDLVKGDVQLVKVNADLSASYTINLGNAKRKVEVYLGSAYRGQSSANALLRGGWYLENGWERNGKYWFVERAKK